MVLGRADDPVRLLDGVPEFGRVVDQRWLDPTTGTASDRFRYGYDRDGNRLYRTNVLDSALDELYHAGGASAGYDALGQLTGFARGALSDTNSDGVPDTVASPSRTQAWDFDELGNWQSVTTNGTAQSRTHDRQNKLTGVGSATLTYDANGNLTTDEAGRGLTYDAWNRLVAVEDAGSNPLVDYAYDALGRRITADAGTTRAFYYSAGWQVLEEREAGGGVAENVWSLAYVDALVLRDRNADGLGGTLEERLYVHQDANWNVTALVATSGAVVERYAYDPYGAVTILTPSWGSRSSSSYEWVHLHQGGRYDGTSGLYHFRNRDFSPTLGRWVSQDPIGFAAGDANLYRYVGNTPSVSTDPLGLQTQGKPARISPPSSGPDRSPRWGDEDYFDDTACKLEFNGYKELKDKYGRIPTVVEVFQELMSDDEYRKIMIDDWRFTSYPNNLLERGGWILWNPEKGDIVISRDGVTYKTLRTTHHKWPKRLDDNKSPACGSGYYPIYAYHMHPSTDSLGNDNEILRGLKGDNSSVFCSLYTRRPRSLRRCAPLPR